MAVGRLFSAVLAAGCLWVLVSVGGILLGDYDAWHQALVGSSTIDLLTRMLGASATFWLFLVLSGPRGARGEAGSTADSATWGGLSEAGLRLSLAEDRNELLRRLGEEVTALVGEALVFVSLFDERTGFVTTVYSSGLGKVATGLVKRLGQERHSISFSIDPGSVSELQKGQLLRLPEGLHQTTFFRVSRSLCRLMERIYGLSSIYGAGLSWREVVHGSVCIAPKRTDELPNAEMVETLCRETSAALHVIRLQKSLDGMEEERSDIRRRLGEVVASMAELAAMDDPDRLFEASVELAVSRLGLDRFSFWLTTAEDDLVQGTYGTDEEGRVRDERGSRRLIPSDSTLWQMLKEGENYKLDRSTALKDYRGNTVGTGDRIYAPVRVGDSLIGLVTADNLLSGKPLRESDGLIIAIYGRAIGMLHNCLLLRSRRSS